MVSAPDFDWDHVFYLVGEDDICVFCGTGGNIYPFFSVPNSLQLEDLCNVDNTEDTVPANVLR